MSKSILGRNALTGILTQVVIIILGVVVPKIMITSYGSDTNGFMGTVSQIFTYMALLEAGIGQAAVNAIYKPLAEHDTEGISYVATLARRYYRKFTVVYGLAVLAAALVVPLAMRSSLSWSTMFFVILLEGMSGVFSFYFIETWTTILTADGRSYVNNYVNVINKTLGYLAKIVLAFLGINIVALEVVFFVITLSKVAFYSAYCNNKYNWIDFNSAPKQDKLPNRHSFVVADVAWTIFSSTDMIVLSTFLSTSLASVYNVYNLIYSSLNMVVNSLYNSTYYILGQTFHRDREQYCEIHDSFSSILFGLSTALVCTAQLLTIPFMRLYTEGFSDVNYIYPQLPVLFGLVQLFTWCRFVNANLVMVAGYARPSSIVALTEAILNIVLSVLLVRPLGLVGVLLGTIVAQPIRMVFSIFMGERVILRRSFGHVAKILVVNFGLYTASVLVGRAVSFSIGSYVEFFVCGFFIFLFIGGLSLLLNCLVNPSLVRFIAKNIKKVSAR